MKSLLCMSFCLLVSCFSLQAQKNVVINGSPLADEVVAYLEYQYQVQIQAGRYWYDAVNGWWGVQGQAVAGVIAPGMNLGGRLQAQASNGRTGVFINGRQVNSAELYHLKRIVGDAIPRGYYWMDAYGNAGPNGSYATVNIYQAAQRGQSRSTYSRSFATDVGYGSNGKDFYIMGDGFSYTNF
ncbi:MAG: hypothetical protein AAF399_21470 [Bacteroidota bacterium]